ncbi:beta-galactosidase, partial [Vibrio sp. EA2]|nr:beta-galactosidase [Vibrio sp. EA2]
DNVDPNAWICRWDMAGIGQWERECVSCQSETLEQAVQVTSIYAYHFNGDVQAITTWVHTLNNDGKMQLDVEVKLADNLPPMPRIGLEMQLPLQEQNTTVTWQGLGPFENYPDRLAAARFGLHTQTLDQMHTPYIFPTDSGLRCGTRNLEINELIISGDFQFSVSQYAQHALAEAKHTNEIDKEEQVYLRLDHKHMGVGGDDSWSPSVHKEFQLTDNHYAYRVSFQPA